MDKTGEKAEKSKLKIIWESLKASYGFGRKGVIFSIISAAISAVAPYIPIFISAKILNMLFVGEKFKNLIITAITGLLITFAVQLIESYINKLRDYHVDIAMHNFHMAETNKLFDMDYSQLDSPETNDLRERIRNDTSWGYEFIVLYGQLSWFLGSVFKFTAAVAVLVPLFTSKIFWGGSTSVYLTVLAVIVIVIVFIIMKYVSPSEFKVMDNWNMNTDRKEKCLGYFTRGNFDYREGKDIRIYNADKMIEYYMKFGEKKQNRWVKDFSRINGIWEFFNSFKWNILQGGVYILVVLRAVAGALSVGSVVMYSAAIINFINGISDIFLAFDGYYIAGKRQQGVLEYLNMKSDMHKGAIPVEKHGGSEYEIKFKNVSFKYPGNENYVLKNLSMKFYIGQKLAVVGMNGSGKTTVIKLLCRLYDPTEGEITLNNIDIKEYDYDEYMNIFSVVFQDFKLFSLPIGQNVAAAVEYDKIKAGKCLNMAGFGDRFESMPKKSDTSLYKDYEEDGVEISGGEAQKIAIARALYKDAPFIVLDEPTAALDPIAEFEMYSKFNEIVGGKTAIYISHRLSSCRFCDDIAVFHEGELIQRGSHDALIADENGKYHELWHAQAQYYSKNNANSEF
ncbi:MAG: ABC transporter ATP-binding protein/permease [Oscillospiraceae bacterium]|nr:ABC transporter ATP-binding protein/permease [Oscillospiraceae bacterium]